MTGPEHYQRAEIAQEAAAALQASRDPGPEYTATEALLDALVHATLALAAAMCDTFHENEGTSLEAWAEVTS